MLGRLWADHRWACLLSLALVVVGVVVSPWVLIAAVVPIGWMLLKAKTATGDQLLTITEEPEPMSELPDEWKDLSENQLIEKISYTDRIDQEIIRGITQEYGQVQMKVF